MHETLMAETLARIMIAGSHSGVGKTTVSSAIIAGLTARGLRVQPFKAGPDYIDPSHLTRAAQVAGHDLEHHDLERPSLESHSFEYHDLECRNLDPYILPVGTLEALFVRAAARADVALIEGVMGLFDGKDADSDAFSSADLANRLQTPVILVLDVGGTARSAAAMALGFQQFAPNLKLAGVILNRVGSSHHSELCEVALAQVGIRSFGFLEATAELELPERHLGLILAGEAKLDLKAFVRAAQTLDLDGILEVARAAGPLEVPANSRPDSRPDSRSDSGQKTRARIAIARDAAFNFYYADALETLLDCGAQLVPFSPLEDDRIPEADGLFIGGGYPELHAAKLAANTTMLEGVRAFCASGKPVVAECGGLMYLAESLTDLEGRTHAMCAVIPAKSRMLERPVLGYREVIALEDSAIALAGTTLRGHEFHYSSLEAPSSQSSQSESRSAYRYADGTETEGFVVGNILASYIHLHFASDPALAQRFVTNAVRFAPPVRP